ncbi:MAG: LURP-one-related/scramblase family protein [Lachnospiraceae bacterium]
MQVMKLLFKQRLFSWFDSYDIYNEAGETVYTVKGQLSWGHCLKIFDTYGNEIGTVKERILTFLPKFEIYLEDKYIGCISKEFTFLKPKYNIDYNGWHIEGDFFEWDYSILSQGGQNIATVSKQLFNLTDTYIIDVNDSQDALCALMLVLAIDAEKCSRN